MRTLTEIFLKEATIFQAISTSNDLLKSCADRCRKTIKNGKNYTYQVSVCTSKCKIQALANSIKSLQQLKGTGTPQEVLNSRIMYMQMRMNKEIQKMQRYRMNLKKRQWTTPRDMSMKPSMPSKEPL